jgi:hypothetical protein
MEPLVKAVRRDKAPPFSESSAEGGFFRNGLTPGVDQPVADFYIAGPKWHQPPAQEVQVPKGVARQLPYHGNILGWGDIVTGREVDFFGQVKVLLDLKGRSFQSKSAAHDDPFW